MNFYGASAAVYRARLTPEARAFAINNGASPLAAGDFALKIVYNFDPLATYSVVLQAAQMEIDLFRRLPHHSNIVRIEHYLTSKLPIPRPVDWDADPSTMGESTLYMVMEQCHLSLQDVISHRKLTAAAMNSKTSLFAPEEVLLVGRDISSALILLNKELIAHRDIKPDNILIRLPSDDSVTRDQALTNINQRGITTALADFGTFKLLFTVSFFRSCIK
jgi:serine/threonine protein kinase